MAVKIKGYHLSLTEAVAGPDQTSHPLYLGALFPVTTFKSVSRELLVTDALCLPWG